ncbi:MAG TPA: multicopper oxidase family protein [Bryobacteraceae bacterium]|nr:multicopper oxidase family protein [Bryobacteraceae bacterium]
MKFWISYGFVIFSAVSAAGAESCSRPAPGSLIEQPQDVFSSNGVLKVMFSFRSAPTRYGFTRYCYVYDDSLQSPTLRVRPGEELLITLKNDVLGSAAGSTHVHSGGPGKRCAGGEMSEAVTNLHFHGLSVPPTCGQDEVLHTLIQPSGAFEYRVRIPKDQPPGLYWYHPHPHGFSEAQVLGGASGALIVEGIERANPKVAGLPERVLILRDQRIPGAADSDEDRGPGKDISLNFVPVIFPLYKPAEMSVRPGEREFWRVLNASADTYFDLQLRYGPVIQDVNEPQTIELVALDGAPAGGASQVQDVLLPPGARAEFIAATPPLGIFAQLVTLKYDTGPDGAATPYRTIANIRSSADAPPAPSKAPTGSAPGEGFQGLEKVKPARQRKLYFSEERPDLTDPTQQPRYYITVEGQTPKLFSMDFTNPDIVAEQSTVEDWIIENRARDAHAFHIHQVHFQLLERDGHPLHDPALRDTIDLPFWDGKSSFYPSVKLRMDFRSKEIVGTFVFHCHILEHEDGGMMGSIRVTPAARASGKVAGKSRFSR